MGLEAKHNRNDHNRNASSCAKSNSFRLRVCLRKGCGRTYRPVRGNQRYCQDPHCLREVKRWQSAKRQRRARKKANVRHKHAADERRRRFERKAARRTATADAWSRTTPKSERLPADICDRPGCYQPPRFSVTQKTRYCSKDCRDAVRRVRERERKWLNRQADGSSEFEKTFW